MADTVIENLITKLSFNFNDKKLEKFDKFLGTAVKGLTGVVAVAAAAGTAIFLFTQKVAGANDELGKFAQRIGIPVESLQELGYVAELNGGSINSMNSSLESLGRIASEASRGLGAGVEVFGMLGMSVTDSNGRVKEADVLLNDVSDSISKLGTQAEKLEFAQKLGISGDLLLAIKNGSDAIKKQREEARELGFVFGDDAAKAAADFTDAMLKQNRIIKGITTLIGTKFMKIMVPMTERFVAWYKINKDIIKQNIISFLDKAIYTFKIIYTGVNRVVGIVTGLVTALGGLKNTLVLVTGVLLAMNASALLMPILLAAAAAGLMLILEDIIKFAEGGDSAIGNLLQDFPVLNQMLTDFISLLRIAKEGWEGLFESQTWDDIQFFFKDIWNKIGSIGAPEFKPKVVRSNKSQKAVGGNTTNNSTNATTININGGDTDKVRQVVGDVLAEQYSGAQTNLESQTEY
jgi:hypothetical protein